MFLQIQTVTEKPHDGKLLKKQQVLECYVKYLSNTFSVTLYFYSTTSQSETLYLLLQHLFCHIVYFYDAYNLSFLDSRIEIMDFSDFLFLYLKSKLSVRQLFIMKVMQLQVQAVSSTYLKSKHFKSLGSTTLKFKHFLSYWTSERSKALYESLSVQNLLQEVKQSKLCTAGMQRAHRSAAISLF